MPARGSFGEYVVIDPRKLAEFLRSPQGPLYRRLIEDGDVVKEEARRIVGVYQPPDAYSATHRQRRPGTLRDSIVKRVVEERGLPAVLVGSEDPIALIHHEGTQPHTIQPRTAPALVFYWPRVGHVVRLREVHHPGTQPNRYLVRALAALRGRY